MGIKVFSPSTWIVPPHALTLLVLLPLLGALWIALFSPSNDQKKVRPIVSLSTFFALFLAFALWIGFEASTERFSSRLQFEDVWEINQRLAFHLGINGSLLYCILFVTCVMVLSVISAWEYISHRPRKNAFALLLTESLALAVLTSSDLFLRNHDFPITAAFIILAGGMFIITRRAL